MIVVTDEVGYGTTLLDGCRAGGVDAAGGVYATGGGVPAETEDETGTLGTVEVFGPMDEGTATGFVLVPGG